MTGTKVLFSDLLFLFVQEAAWLLDEGMVPEDKCAARAIGYRQAMEFLQRCRADPSHISADSLVTHPPFLGRTYLSTLPLYPFNREFFCITP